MALYTFKCGCEFDVAENGSCTEKQTGLPAINLNIAERQENDLTFYGCKRTWDLICDGRTKGVFQLESNLGKSWAKRLKPRSIEELAALVSLIRPGCLKAIVSGKSMTQHYVDRKHGEEEIEYLHDSLEPILKSTQGVLVYQEQSMQIAQAIAGFDLQQADELRKAIGKKKADLMASVKKDFLSGAEDVGLVPRETAEEIFSWIEKSNRYAFNKSHAVSYAICGYWSAYSKAHFPINFYCNYLFYSKGKPDSQREIQELISDAKMLDIFVYPPSIVKMDKSFSIHESKINFGIGDVKFIGDSQVLKTEKAIANATAELSKPSANWSWLEFLVFCATNLTSKVVTSLISVGSLSHLGLSRNKMLYEYDLWSKLTSKEKSWVAERMRENSWGDLKTCLEALCPVKKMGGGTSTVKRSEIIRDFIHQIEHPPYELNDDPEWISQTEAELLGASLTYSKVEACDTTAANSTCKEFANGKSGAIVLAVAIKGAREYKISRGQSKGKNMGFLTVEDASCELDNVICFSEEWGENKHLLYEGNTVLMTGERSKKKDSLIVQKVFQI
jgi:DNA polymerase III alpha subunit|tara:strand:- start:11815 stop:13491 length:1677 start_codon:yes stop_codon:yes gene_type:complete